MKKKNSGMMVLVIVLGLLVLGALGYIVYGIVKDSGITSKNIKIDTEKEYVYDANYSYDNEYKEFTRGKGKDEVVSIDYFGISVNYKKGRQYLSDLKVPYLNINSSYAKDANSEIEKLYMDYAKKFDSCATLGMDGDNSCSLILTYRTYEYNDILSVVVIYSEQYTSVWSLNYNVYNFDLKSGNEIKYSSMVDKLGYDNSTLLDKEKELLKNKMDETWGKYGDLSSDCNKDGNKNCYDIANKLLEDSINDDSILFFVNNSGNLSVLATLYADFPQNASNDRYVIEVIK